MAGLSVACAGMCSIVCSSTFYTAVLVLLEISARMGWPQFCMTATSSALTTIGVAIILSGLRLKLPSKAALLGATLSALSFASAIVAVELGTPLGDFSSLNSAATAFACLLGYFILGEKLSALRMASVVACFGGALLVARPQFLFGNHGVDQTTGDTLWIGHLASLGSGCLDAAFFVSFRFGAASPNPTAGALSVNAAVAVVSIVFASVRGEPFVSQVGAAPLQYLGLSGALTAIVAIQSACMVYGAEACPAAVSSVLDIGTRIVLGFLSQVLLFGIPPQPISLCGAALMILGVMLIPLDVARKGFDHVSATSQGKAGVSTNGGGIGSACASTSDSVAAAAIDDETESLSSFVGTELTTFGRPDTWLRSRQHVIVGNSRQESAAGVAANVFGTPATSI
eukprot:TRINITY_DN33019_c0_g1_i1.p1 TRINITY_DN33019_c0_g1~~TRINITY_DN33019_c0_g1_i1.p1  ORF type:complete len:398 (+),score=44.77 TRINITY_DN33019_c0_g1_i1:64-1257(+)